VTASRVGNLSTAVSARLRLPAGVLAGPRVRLFLTSSTILFVELLLIRWIPANVTYVGYFRNFLLMASFLGIGAGILYGRDARAKRLSLFVPLLFALVALTSTTSIDLQLRSDDEIFFGLEGSTAADTNFLVLPLFVMLTTILMATLAIPLGPLLRAMPPLDAYAVDIGGSMAGVAAFAALSALQTTPVTWFVVLAVLLALGALGSGVTRSSYVGGAFMLAIVGLSLVTAQPTTSWSPYYRITEHPGNPWSISVNGIPHQGIWATADVGRRPIYEQVYRWFPDRVFERVLIVGAGTGTDTAVALAHGAHRIDAVEIDPRILQIGVERHPNRPYDDPRVRTIVDDGRAFIRSTAETYDLVIFALPDSLTLVSTSANLRLESFLFTTEAFAEVRDVLGEDGVFVLYNYYRQPWLVDKIAGMLELSFGHRPMVERYGSETAGAATLAAGPLVVARGVPAEPSGGSYLDPPAVPRPATDDWPFLYLRAESVPAHYLVALSVVLLWALLVVARASRRARLPIRRFSPHFFVLGIAFLLLETRSLVTFSLLFGSTWLVNALVFFAILASVLLAVAIARRVAIRSSRPLYVALLGAVLLAYLLPPDSLLIDPPSLRYVIAASVAFAPVFLANLVFSYSFRDTRTADMAFASNLLGAMVGGVLEYLALVTGYQALLLILAGLYVLAYLLATRARFLADRELVAERDLAAQPAG
jgi:SAM-dependent methyltransferase